jgi:hypothetical protein
MAHDESIFERVSEISSMLMEGDASVDETAGILRGVKMCGTVSPSNRRKWPADVLAAARERYEGAPSSRAASRIGWATGRMCGPQRTA